MISFWEKNIYLKKYDIAIIGAGFSGMWLAYFLKQSYPKLHIVIFEKGVFPSGASSKNAGFACFGSPSELLENIKLVGSDQTFYWAEKRFQGIQIIKDNFEHCIEYNPCGGTELFDKKQLFEESFSALHELNKEISHFTDNQNHFFEDKNIIEKCGFRSFKYAISNLAEASIHSVKLLEALQKKLQALDVKIFFGIDVVYYEPGDNKVDIYTKNGIRFEASHLNLCTNAFTSQFLIEEKILPGRGQVLITNPIKNLNWNRTFHYNRGSYYFRNYKNRVLLGGGRHLNIETEATTNLEITEEIQSALEEMLYQKILPEQNPTIEQRWSGIMAFTENKAPISKILNPRLSINAGMNGMGVALTPWLSQALALEIGNFIN